MKKPCDEKTLMTIDDCEPCPKRKTCKKNAFVRYFGEINQRSKRAKNRRYFSATMEADDVAIVLSINEKGGLFPESTRFEIARLKERHPDLKGLTIREGYLIPDIGIDNLSARINFTVSFEEKRT